MERLLLSHPKGKKSITMDKEKYTVLKKALLTHLKTNGESTHKEMYEGVMENFKKNKIKFDGAVEWHMEWVKLDMEAKKVIKRVGDKSPIKFAVVK